MAHISLIRRLAALSLACLMVTAVVAQETRVYPFTEVERNRRSSDILYDGFLQATKFSQLRESTTKTNLLLIVDLLIVEDEHGVLIE